MPQSERNKDADWFQIIASHIESIHPFAQLSRLQLGNRNSFLVVGQKSHKVRYNLLRKVIDHKRLGHMYAKVV